MDRMGVISLAVGLRSLKTGVAKGHMVLSPTIEHSFVKLLPHKSKTMQLEQKIQEEKKS